MRMVPIVLAVVVLIVLLSSLYIVREPEQVIITQFGKPIGDPITTPGLKVKAPIIQKVHRFDKRFLEWDGDPNQLPTKDKRFIWVDMYARWGSPIRSSFSSASGTSAVHRHVSMISSTERPETRSRIIVSSR